MEKMDIIIPFRLDNAPIGNDEEARELIHKQMGEDRVMNQAREKWVDSRRDFILKDKINNVGMYHRVLHDCILARRNDLPQVTRKSIDILPFADILKCIHNEKPEFGGSSIRCSSRAKGKKEERKTKEMKTQEHKRKLTFSSHLLAWPFNKRCIFPLPFVNGKGDLFPFVSSDHGQVIVGKLTLFKPGINVVNPVVPFNEA